jgi:hypothetical protein
MQTREAAMNPSTPKTEPPPSNQLRKEVSIGCLQKTLVAALLSLTVSTHAEDGKALTANLISSLHDIPAYGATNFIYKKENQPSLKVRLGEPAVIVVATKPEKWGWYQFPSISRWPDGTLEASWAMLADSITSYGKAGSGSAISTDGGKTWQSYSGKLKAVDGLLLLNGDRLQVVTPKAIKTSELHLPSPVGMANENYSKVKQPLYRHSELPPEVQGVCLSRLAKGSTQWVSERAALDDPQALRYSLIDLFPIIWWGDMHNASDGSVIAGIYPGYRLRDDGTTDPKDGVFFYRSTDAGHSWKIQGRIPYQPDLAADAKGAERMGFTEPAYEILADGTFLCILRTTDGLGIGPMYASRSSDLGKTWSKPEVIAPFGVLPKLLKLENGVVVLSSGRPGVQLRFTMDGKVWSDPLELLPIESGKQPDQISCGYTSLLATGPDRFLIIYSDFRHPNEQKESRKAIKVREVSVIPQK